MPADLIQKKKDKLSEWIQSETDEELIEFLSTLKKQREQTDWWKKLSNAKKKLSKKVLMMQIPEESSHQKSFGNQ